MGWWFGILGVPLSNNPFDKGIPGIQTTIIQFDQFVFFSHDYIVYMPGSCECLWLFGVYGGKNPSYTGIIINHYDEPYWPTNISCFFVAQLSIFLRNEQGFELAASNQNNQKHQSW